MSVRVSAKLSGARMARASWLGRLISKAAARDLSAFVVPGPEVARARGLDLRAAGLDFSPTPRHASVLVVVGRVPEGLREAADVVYAQMPRPRAVLAVGTEDVWYLPEPDVSVELDQDELNDGVAKLRRLFTEGAFDPEAEDFEVAALRSRTQYTCSMHPEVVQDVPGTCPKCGMDLIPREAAVDDGHAPADQGLGGHAHGGHDHAHHAGMTHDERAAEEGQGHTDHSHPGREYRHDGSQHTEARPTEGPGADDEERNPKEHGPAHSDARGGHGSINHEGMDHGAHDLGEEGHGHEKHGCMDKGGMNHGSHESMDHGAEKSGEHEGHGGHEGMDHGDMEFMSMVEMTQGTPRSSDGLQMEWVETPFGPLFPGLPGGLALTFTLDGDTVAEAEAASTVGARAWEDLNGPVGAFVERLARVDPLAPVSYRLLALRAVESAAGTRVESEVELARVSALERERVASHLNWLAGFGYLIGYSWLARRAEELQLALLRADAEGMAGIRPEVRKLARRAEWTPLLRRKLGGLGKVPDLAGVTGPVARAGGRWTDARMEEETYRSVGFEPVVVEGNDALARMRVRLMETERSLDLVEKAGPSAMPSGGPEDSASGRGRAVVETPRGSATLVLTLNAGEATVAELETPSTRHMGLVKPVTEQRELGDALAGVASLDLSPWEIAR